MVQPTEKINSYWTATSGHKKKAAAKVRKKPALIENKVNKIDILI